MQSPEQKTNQLKQQVQKIRMTNTIPLIKDKVKEVINREDSSLREIEEILKHDPSLCQRIVSLSSSSSYGQVYKGTDICQALIVLGFNNLRGILKEVPVFQSNMVTPKLIALWMHSFEVAEACQEIAGRAAGVSKEDAFLAGLLHDIGKIALYQLFRTFYWASLSDVTTPSELLDKETEAFGADHPRVGGWFLHNTLLPERIVIAVENHHHPLKTARFRELAAAVYLAEYLVTADRDTSYGVKEVDDSELKQGLDILKITEKDTVQFMVDILTRREKTKAFYGNI